MGNPVIVKAYSDGFPANGKPVPDGAMMAKIEWLNAPNPAAPYGVTVAAAARPVKKLLDDGTKHELRSLYVSTGRAR